MKPTGIVRNVDELGRIVLPKELRNILSIEVKTPMEIFTNNDTIVLRKYEPADIFTGEMNDLVDFEGKKVAKANILKLCELAGIKVVE
ncbi:MAG: AbrB/MazE/SpoVT family DNA-binding domain-containing protein [Clostridiales bacterium]|nr:AbrB/MazE/SpoVT family DNA-binding domain-containing protein [Clostridiales bacterium]MCD8159459.1 AbrB/MazE/SpoVT family DNA-binding domain-containing protein [Clostridiales bacterium]